MTILFLDAETYYDQDYSLSNMTVPEYVLDPRYENILWAAAVDDGPAFAIDGPDFPEWLSQYDPAKVTTVTFNSLFDNFILAFRHGFVPARMLDPMGMARALRGHMMASVSLANVAVALKLQHGEKGSTIGDVKGMRRAEIMSYPGLWGDFKRYAIQDVNLMRDAFNVLAPEFPASERRIMDRVLRCAIQPRFNIDVPMLQAHYDDVKAEKFALLQRCNVDAKTLNSNIKFKELLEERGIEVEMKISTTGNEIPAFAKTDEFMAELLEHEDEDIQALAMARLGMKSSLEEKRAQRLLAIAQLPWGKLPDGNPRLYSGGTMPIPLRFSGAHTHRLSGDWKINMQNLPSGRGTTKGSKLRKALIAPPGHKVVKIDLSQIEARITAWLCKEMGLLNQFANKLDPYGILGCSIFGITPEQMKERGGKESLERFIGKSGILGLGFGCGAPKFYNMVIRSARNMGMDVNELKKVWTPALAKQSVLIYRRVNQNTVNTWAALNNLLDTAWSGKGATATFGPVKIGYGIVELPSGLPLRYKVLPPKDNELRYQYGKRTHKIYGAKFLENIVQALARIVIMNAMLRLWDRGYQFKLQEHDALAFVIPDNKVDEACRVIYEEVCRPPSWGKDIPLAADIGVGASYGTTSGPCRTCGSYVCSGHSDAMASGNSSLNPAASGASDQSPNRDNPTC
jgi:DNA polymerase